MSRPTAPKLRTEIIQHDDFRRRPPSGVHGDIRPSRLLQNLENWPNSWILTEKDLPEAQALLRCLLPFIAHLASSSLSPSTIGRHMNNVWRLGKAIVRDVRDNPSLKGETAEQRLRKAIHEEGGPFIREEQRSFDATCRKLHRFFNRRR